MEDILTKEGKEDKGKEDEEVEEHEKEEEEEEQEKEEESESVVLKRLCETFGDSKSLSEVYHSAEKHHTYREESSLSDDVNTVDESETHDEIFFSPIKETEGENNTTVINTGSDDSLQETEVKSSSHDKDLEMGYHKIGTSVQSGVDECSTARQELSSEQGLRVRTIKMDPKITVQLVENEPVISMETDKNKSILMLEAGNDKPTLQKKRNDLDVPLESDSDGSDLFFSPIHAVKYKHDETVQPERNEENTLFHSSKSEDNVTANEINDQPFSSKVFTSTPVNTGYGFIPQDVTGIKKSVNILISQSKHETTTPNVNNHNDRTVDICKDKVFSSGEDSNTMKGSTNKGSESQCDEHDSITSISTNVSVQTVGANENENGGDVETPESFERIFNELKTRLESVSYQENVSDPVFISEVNMLEETVQSIESDSCGPSRLEQVRNTTNPLEPLHISILPRGNDYGNVQYDALMDNANDAVVPNILNQSNEQQISRINSVNIDAAPVIFEDLFLQEEIVYDREVSTEAPDLQLPINAAQILQMADSMEESLCSSDSEHHRRVPATGPQPEALIETEVCRGNLAYHLAEQHKKLKEILEAAEKQLKDLELKIMDDSERMRPADIKCRLKKIIKILNLVNNLGKQDNVQATKSVSNSK